MGDLTISDVILDTATPAQAPTPTLAPPPGPVAYAISGELALDYMLLYISNAYYYLDFLSQKVSVNNLSLQFRLVNCFKKSRSGVPTT